MTMMGWKIFHLIIIIFFFFMLPRFNFGRPITDQATFDMVSDGGTRDHKESSALIFRLNQQNMVSSDSCTETYGFLPCTTSVVGNVFLVLVYGYLMFLAAKILSCGSEILLQILGPGIVGGLFLPLLSSLPDAAIILGSKETAETQVSVGMGLLAGSTVMLLTILWGSCLIVGKCDIENSAAIDHKDTQGFSLTGCGVSTDIWTSYGARTMIISLIPFLIVQLPQLLHSTSSTQTTVLLSFIVSISLLVIYSLYQVFQPWIQRRRLAYVKHKNLMSFLLENLKTQAGGGRFLKDNGEINTEVIQKLFMTLDKNLDGCITTKDLRALLIGMHLEETEMDLNEAVDEVMLDFDKSHDSRIDMEEFVRGTTRWLMKAKNFARNNDQSPQTPRLLNDFRKKTIEEQDLLGDDSDDETMGNVKSPRWNTLKAVLMLLLGTMVAAVFADPLVDTVDNFSTATSIPSFFVSFVILPFASSSEMVSALIFASRKKIRTASLTYSEIYGSVTMSNILSLSVMLGVVYIRNLTWNFSSEIAQANRAFGRIIVFLWFEEEGGQRGNDGGVEAGVVGGGVVGDGEAEVVNGGAAAGLAAEEASCVEMKGEDEDEDD
ncbi:sodium/calcium exchanger NCL-like [Senna tora]|uniref:Sodium/calcium exchanger NCL-like n=1 Tax=Senna tora TaxID=362788 RepID=A0A835C703_9FABA|nr:sodium/calcium exchanger NCL-like [Senna tora]